MVVHKLAWIRGHVLKSTNSYGLECVVLHLLIVIECWYEAGNEFETTDKDF